MDALVSIVAGVTVLTVVTIAAGGAFLLSRATDRTLTPLQRSFFRAGHAHAGVLVMLGLLCIVLQRTSGVDPGWQAAPFGVLAAAILMPLGFFCSVWKPGLTEPNRWIWSVRIGGGVLVVSLVVVGLTILLAGVDRL
ncbi:MAG: hypothetical protein QM638_02155 [Nocardioides sp.]|uniref:hypothetical protein n=1 Tax=Nocardioides sp. TaxID=35761 RepID=UPI0039E493C8